MNGGCSDTTNHEAMRSGHRPASCAHALAALPAAFRDRLHVALAPAYDSRDSARFARLTAQAAAYGLPTVATAMPLMHRASRRQLADVLTCIREGCTVETLGARALPNAERHLRDPAQMARLFAANPEALRTAERLADACTFSLDELRYEYPDEGNGETPQDRLARLADEGLRWRYPDGVPHGRGTWSTANSP